MIKDIRRGRNMPWLKRGMAVDMNGKRGKVTGDASSGMNIRVRFNGSKFSSICHPWWEMTYYAKDGAVIADYKK